MGCTGELQVLNSGPNPIQVTANPSPDKPALPLVIAVGETGTLTYGPGFTPSYNVNLQVADPTSGLFDTEDVVVPGESRIARVWNGSIITDFTP